MQTPSDALLARYVAGECTPTEAREVEQWCRTSPAHQARLDGLRTIWNARRAPRRWDVEGIWARVRRTMRAGARAVAEDIGTRFDLRAYAEDSLVAVAVAEGAVALGRGAVPAETARRDGRPVAEGIVVRPGEIATLAPNGAVTTARGAALAD